MGIQPVQVGKYQLLDRIGAGGMAEVHLARVIGAAGFEKLVVVKRLLPALAEEADYVSQFIDEARLAAAFSHANIVSTFDFGEADGSYYIAMEYVEGKNLRRIQDVLDRRGKRLPEPAAVYVVSELCRGLEYAHTRKDAQGKPMKVVHRDVSPQNVVVSYGGDVKVLDFGIAKSAAREFQTAAGIVKGKLRYMAPEQVAGEPIDGRADLFAAGVILWELLYGKRPMPEMPDSELVNWVRKGEFTRPTNLPEAPPDLKSVLDRALAPDPTVRFPSCGDFARALTRFNSQHWPDFTPGDLGRLLESEFSEDMRKERAWIAAILEQKTEASISVHVAPPSLKANEQPSRDDIVTVATPTGGVKAATGQLHADPISGTFSRGNISVSKVPSSELPIVKGGYQAPADTAPPWPIPRSVPNVADLSGAVRAPGRSRLPLFLGLAAVLVLAVGAATGAHYLLPHATPTPATPVPTPFSLTPTPAAVVSSTPAPTPTAVAIVSTAPRPTATPRHVVVVHPSLIPPPPTPPPVALNAHVSVNALNGWGVVYMDGVKLAPQTPIIPPVAIAAGRHEFRVVAPDGRVGTATEVIQAGERNHIVIVRLPPK